MSDVQKESGVKRPKSVYIDPNLHRSVKIHSARSGKSIQAFCEDALREKMAAEADQREHAA